MRIILSPAKKMNDEPESVEAFTLPVFLEQTEEILDWLKSKNAEELQKLWKCNDQIAVQNVERLKNMDLRNNLTPAIISYEGIAYQYMAPAVFEDGHLEYVQEHLRILSAFYGALRPMDGVTPYRLEMQAKASIAGKKNLYDLWGKRLYDEVTGEEFYCTSSDMAKAFGISEEEMNRTIEDAREELIAVGENPDDYFKEVKTTTFMM